MTSAELRMVFGRTSAFAPSDFLNEISSDLVEYLNKTPIASRQVFQRGDYGDSYNTHSLRNTTTSFEDAAKELNKKLNYFMKAEPANQKQP